VKFDYQNFEGVGFFDIIVFQIAINAPWIFAFLIIVFLIIFLHIKRK